MISARLLSLPRLKFKLNVGVKKGNITSLCAVWGGAIDVWRARRLLPRHVGVRSAMWRVARRACAPSYIFFFARIERRRLRARNATGRVRVALLSRRGLSKGALRGKAETRTLSSRVARHACTRSSVCLSRGADLCARCQLRWSLPCSREGGSPEEPAVEKRCARKSRVR
jgi:hypothetical protein